ncbi:MAG: YdcF family protein, partial [Actinomycetota bacterium]
PGREVLLNARRRPGSKPPKKSSTAKKSSSGRSSGAGKGAALLRKAASGGVLGVLIWLMANQLGAATLPLPLEFHQYTVAIVVGAVLGITRWRTLLWAAAGVLCFLFVAIAHSPVVKAPIRALIRKDALRPADAVVVLSSNVRKSGEMDTTFQVRVLHGYEVVRQGYAPRLVVTRLNPKIAERSTVPEVRKQMALLDMEFPVDEVGPVGNTYDEARKVAELVRKRGWRRVILVSDPTHMRRAGATFAHAGVTVIHSPCRNPGYDLTDMEGARDRLLGFQDWFHETIGYWEYRRRGWL